MIATGESTDEQKRSTRATLTKILLAGLAIRLIAWWLTAETPLAADELEYFWRGAARSQGLEPEDFAFRPPAMELLYGAVFSVTGTSVNAARLANVVLGVALLVPLYALGRHFGGSRTGLLAAALGAVYPSWVAFSHYLWSETLYTLLALSGLVALCAHVDSGALRKLAVAGLALGASTLARVVGLGFPLLAATWLLWRARLAISSRPGRALAAPACLIACVAASLAPWTLHLNEPNEPFALVTRSTWHYLYIGNGEPFRGVVPSVRYRSLGANQTEREAAARDLVLPQIRKRLPMWPLEKIASELPAFFTPASFPVRRLLMPPDHRSKFDRMWSYRLKFEPEFSPRLRRALAVPVIGAYVLVVLVGAAGLVLAPRSSTRDVCLLFVLSQIAPTLLTFAISRFRFASMAVCLVSTAWVLLHGRDAWRNASTARRTGAIAVATAIALMIALRVEDLTENAWA